ncbi:MAG: hypothetical protein ACM65M_16125 [Microcoleus sp.]
MIITSVDRSFYSSIATGRIIAVFGIWCQGRTPLNKSYESAIGHEA